MSRSLGSIVTLLVVSALSVACTDDTDWDRTGAAASPAHDAVADGEETDPRSPLTESAALEQIALLVDDSAEADDVPGVVVGVRWPDGRQWVHAAGVADVETQRAIDPAAQWPARSITKSFTVTALLRSVDGGSISIDEPVGQYVDGVEGGDDVTLGDLALMTSGLPDYTNERFAEAFVEDPTRVFEDEELLAFVEGEPLEAPPGTEHRYINTNTLLLGMALAEATGSTVDDLLEGISEPLGLDRTRYRPDPSEVDVPTGYQPDGELLEPIPLTFGVFGAAGAMVTDLDDLLLWGEELGRGAGLGSELAALRRDVAAPLVDGPEYDSYGLGIGELGGWWGHTGEGLGYTALVMNDLTSGTTVAVVSNVSNLERGHVPTQLFRRIAPLLAPAA